MTWWFYVRKELTNTTDVFMTAIASLGMCLAGPVLLVLLLVGMRIERRNIMKWDIIAAVFIIMVVAWLFLDVTMMGDYSIIRNFFSTSITDLTVFELICILFFTNIITKEVL